MTRTGSPVRTRGQVPRALVLVVLGAMLAGLALAPADAAARQRCGSPCGIVRDNLLIGWRAAKSYAASHRGRLPTGKAWVNAVLDVTAGLDPGVGGLRKARRLDDPAAVLISPASTSKVIILWGRADNGVVVSLTAKATGGPTFHYGG